MARFGDSLQRWALVAVVLVLVVAAGAVAVIGADGAASSQERLLRQDRLALAKSLATLADGYFMQLESSQASVAAALRPRTQPSALAVAVAQLPGDPVAIVGRSDGSVQAAAPGTGGLAAAWARSLDGQLSTGPVAISQVAQLGGHPVVVVAARLAAAQAAPAALVVAYRLDRLPIAAYVQQLTVGVDARPYLLDSAGRLVTSPDTAQVGSLASPPLRSALGASRGPAVVTSSGSPRQVVAVVPAGLAGWHLVVVQPARRFYGALWHADTIVRWLMLGFLVVVAAALLLLHAKRQAALHAVAQMAVRDALTSLPNRVAFSRALASAMERHRRDSAQLALLFCDLDGFKAVNDQFGHAAGDLLLVASAERLSGVSASAEGLTVRLARLGGDEFTILLEGRRVRDRAPQVAAAITDAIAEPFVIGGHRVAVGISVGIAFAQPGRDLLRDADVAMYRMKAVRRTAREAGQPDRFSAEPADHLRAI